MYMYDEPLKGVALELRQDMSRLRQPESLSVSGPVTHPGDDNGSDDECMLEYIRRTNCRVWNSVIDDQRLWSKM